MFGEQVAKVGDFVSAKSVAGYAGRKGFPTFDTQGVVVAISPDGTMRVLREGAAEATLCYGPEGVGIVPDDRILLPQTHEWMAKIRSDLGIL